MIHIHEKIKCSCGCEYCPNCHNGCPQCGKGELKSTTTTAIAFDPAQEEINARKEAGEIPFSWEDRFDEKVEGSEMIEDRYGIRLIGFASVPELKEFIRNERELALLEGRTCKQNEIDYHIEKEREKCLKEYESSSYYLSIVKVAEDTTREKIKSDLMKIADAGEIEELRLAVEGYFNSTK